MTNEQVVAGMLHAAAFHLAFDKDVGKALTVKQARTMLQYMHDNWEQYMDMGIPGAIAIGTHDE